MPIIMGQATAPSSATSPLFVIPPSLCSVTFWNVSAGTVYIGTSSANTTVNNGLQCHSIPTSFTTFVGSKGATFWGANTSGTAASVNFIINTDS